MPRTAVLADIHGNLHALKAVLKDIGQAGMEDLVFLGDVVGYGAQPAECVELLRSFGCRGVMGNHDFYTCSGGAGMDMILADPDSGSHPVWAGIRHAREQLDEEQMEWLRGLEPVGRTGEVVLSHAALHDPESWPYLRSPEEARPTLERLGGCLGFFGHTHREAVFSAEDGPPPEQLAERVWKLPGGTSIAVTAGGTGQPRDGDPRARWMAWDPESRTLEFHRVTYDWDAAAESIRAAGLPPHSALRLLP